MNIKEIEFHYSHISNHYYMNKRYDNGSNEGQYFNSTREFYEELRKYLTLKDVKITNNTISEYAEILLTAEYQ